jgi:LuxR family quorum-sensing system transcriptional regulator CciR
VFTPREDECLFWASQGKTSWEIGLILGIGERTANFHIANACSKLGVNTRQAAIAQAIQRNLLDMERHLQNMGRHQPNPGRPARTEKP